MNIVNLIGQRDVPLTTSLLGFMQAAYANLEKLAAVGGDNYIVSGCIVSGTSVSEGWMVLNGILLPFAGGSITATIKITETETVVVVAEGSRTQMVYQATFGESTTPGYQFNWADINSNRIYTLLEATPLIKSNTEQLSGLVTKEKILSFTAWNMYDTETIQLAHGLDETKIRDVSVILHPSIGTIRSLGTISADNTLAGIWSVGDTYVTLDRTDGGYWDKTIYINVDGYVLIRYVD